jgi:hypothetical protein
MSLRVRHILSLTFSFTDDTGEVRVANVLPAAQYNSFFFCSGTQLSAIMGRTQVRCPQTHPQYVAQHSVAVLSFLSHVCTLSTASGYVVDFSPIAVQAANRVTKLFDAHWIDIKTVSGSWFVVCCCGCGLWLRFVVATSGFGLGFVGCGLWVVGCGLWVVGCGLWFAGCGLRVVGCGL